MATTLLLPFLLCARMSMDEQPGVDVARAVLSDKTYECWRTFILPKPFEVTWQSLPWHSKIADAIAEAQREDKPVLIWVMNGHPLGEC
jgi:hypothetical protein